ncbi:MAG: hypothetical protein ACM3X6_14825 [Patescibacteria group bacterium]
MEPLNRFARGLLTGSLLGAATAGTMMLVARRRSRLMAEMRASRMFRNRARRAVRAMTESAARFGSFVRHGTMSMVRRTQKGSWGRA